MSAGSSGLGPLHDLQQAVLPADGHGVGQLADDPLVRDATLFDVYKPAKPVAGIDAGERSLAVRLELQDEQSPLTDERIEAAVEAAVRRAAAAFGARLRA